MEEKRVKGERGEEGKVKGRKGKRT